MFYGKWRRASRCFALRDFCYYAIGLQGTQTRHKEQV